jgi:hypothetical protein
LIVIFSLVNKYVMRLLLYRPLVQVIESHRTAKHKERMNGQR